jgi:flap endonuclease-1
MTFVTTLGIDHGTNRCSVSSVYTPYIEKLCIKIFAKKKISYDKILEETEMTKETFTDLCIMCECDYNSNIYLIGPEKSYTLLKAYNNIENVLEHLKTLKNKDGTAKYKDDMFLPLKYKRCREMFDTNESIVKDIYIPYCDIPNFNDIQDFFFKHNIRYNIEKLKKKIR